MIDRVWNTVEAINEMSAYWVPTSKSASHTDHKIYLGQVVAVSSRNSCVFVPKEIF